MCLTWEVKKIKIKNRNWVAHTAECKSSLRISVLKGRRTCFFLPGFHTDNLPWPQRELWHQTEVFNARAKHTNKAISISMMQPQRGMEFIGWLGGQTQNYHLHTLWNQSPPMIFFPIYTLAPTNRTRLSLPRQNCARVARAFLRPPQRQ